jgi:hypothetical protein
MTLTLKTLRFDRDTSGGAPAASPVRVDKDALVPTIDWKRTGANIAATSVAYPLTLGAGDVADLRVTAAFKASSPPAAAIFVRAKDQGGHVLGDIVKTRIAPSDINNEHPLQLENVALRTLAVGQHTIDWKWEQSNDGISGWTEFDRTTHQIFVTLGQPAPPWGRPGVAHTIVPWHAMTELACGWATGKRDANAAMEAITAKVDALAGTPIGRTGGSVGYGGLGALTAGKMFSVRILLKIVNAQAQIPPELNCRDLNTAVAINASLIGCPLRLIRVRPASPAPMFDTNPIKVFGESASAVQRFRYHEAAAIPGPPIGKRQVFDACVRVDFDTQPQLAPPSDFRLPAGVAIHQTPADMGYRKRLLAAGEQSCPLDEVEIDGIRYPGDSEAELPGDGAASPAPDPFFRERREHFAALLSKAPNSLPRVDISSDAMSLFLTSNEEVKGFPRSVMIGEQKALLSFTPIKPLTPDNGQVGTSVVQAETRQQAIDLFAALAADYAGTLERYEVGDFALRDPTSGAVLLLRGSVVAEISGDLKGDPAPAGLSEAKRLDEELNRFFMASTA